MQFPFITESVFCVSFPKREFRISCYLNTTGYFGDNRQSQEVRRFNYGHAFADRSVNTTRPEEMAKLPGRNDQAFRLSFLNDLSDKLIAGKHLEVFFPVSFVFV